ncbi:MAG: hypothetical protein HYY17_01020 [Planctomycetes bacterium]|nr:hypothetical protein [Planctomycetota bacterium]
METALKPSKSVMWNTYDDAGLAQAKEAGRLGLILFTDDSKSSEYTVNSFENRVLERFFDRATFFKIAYTKDSHEAKLWGVSGGPTLVLFDPAKEPGSKAVLERLTGKRSASQLWFFLGKKLKAQK